MKNKSRLLWVVLTACCNSAMYADGLLEADHSAWHPVVGVGGGVAVSVNLGQSQTFPIINPIFDEYYTYASTRSSQTAGLFEVFLGGERRVMSNWLFQGGVAYSQSGDYHAQGDFAQGADAGSSNQYAYQYKVIAREVLAQAKLMRPYHDTFYPYLLAGIGGSFNQASGFTTNVPPYLTFTRQYQNNTSSSFAYRVGLGVDMDVAQHTRLGLAYRFSGLGNADLGAASIDNKPVSGPLLQSNLYANEVLLQLSYA